MVRAYTKPCGKTYEEQHKAAYELLYAAASFLGLSVGRIEKTEGGKPFFPESPKVFFSIAHTDGMAAVAIGDSPCGIDIEREREISPRIREKYLGNCPADEALLRWTERESYGKYEGSGFFAPAPTSEVAFRTFAVGSFTVTVCTPCGEEVVCVSDGQAFLQKSLD